MSSYLNDLEAQDPSAPQQLTSCDACKHVREAFSGFTKLFGKSKRLTAVFTLIPMIMMFIFFLYIEYGIQTVYFQGYPYEFERLRQFFNPPLTLLACMTFISGGLSIVSLYFGFQNIIGLCSFVYSSIAYWALVNTLIITFCTYDYLNHDVIGYGFLCSSIVSFVWLFSSAVMDAHRKVMNE